MFHSHTVGWATERASACKNFRFKTTCDGSSCKWAGTSIGVRANFVLGGGGSEPSLPGKFFDIARKTAVLTCKITLLTHPTQ